MTDNYNLLLFANDSSVSYKFHVAVNIFVINYRTTYLHITEAPVAPSINAQFRPPSDDKHLQTTFFIISYRFSVADKVKNIEFLENNHSL